MVPKGRSFRRSNPVTLLLAALLTLGFLFFILSPSRTGNTTSAAAAKAQHFSAAEHPLSPPTSPFLKQASVPDDQRAPPPVVHYKLDSLTTSSDPVGNRETVHILTPLARFYQGYWDNILNLDYPHDLISLGFIIPKTREGNAATAALQAEIAKTQSGPEKKRFASITILRQDFDPPLQSQDESERHKLENQKARRAAMAQARNSLLFTTLGPSSAWILWLDSDIVETPPTLIQDLARHDKPIIVPNCYQRYYNKDKGAMDVRPYDYNSWVDSGTAQNLASKMGKDDILLEGYSEMATYRTLMAKLADLNGDPSSIMSLDGVGGTALLVKAEVHRDGAMFPPFPFYHLIETEGFARMAKRLNYQSYGLPNYFVYHYNE
ncbi:glycosyltransferase family 62 protein [Xylona heveae TC161]|uniref:Glycosyltransferase family 62 protein n=1 Tax=Xylona heveae (strain CBS 132557 / TC161) TaxID=1328760 RepID=A0A165HKI8_XYLHT|nr:glycosyltransferase family 62 protein [Xylona heveae TC161]KZF23650.1 glycosyltransferase family 62 protein [Xylona heveae TC161]